DRVSLLMESMFTKAMSDDAPTEEQKAIARVIGDVWLSNLVAWVTRRATATDVATRLELTVRLLLK
ncbi:MAG: TetR/AcrR family transcriptional regulator, cholesterol catabolism regulator, partial [Pseudonocardiales bacterium]|nr:TetR/AcrR family transcriptional regulator, cholesterol catabolism regulator [Pseudonocardiales bacterium]